MEKVRFIAISGTTGVTENLYIYEHVRPNGSLGDILVVDCGVGFPEESVFGVDLVIPDFSYLAKNKKRVRGVLISHAHEDHFGAVPFLLDELGDDIPVYSAKLVAGFITEKLADYGNRNKKINIIDPEHDFLNLGVFRIDPFLVTHSVPDSLGFCITTPIGKFFHVPDYKFDWTPVDQKPFDIGKVARLAKDGVIALASDALGSTSKGYTKSELDLERNIEIIVENAPKKVFFTTISSNISRMQQAINVAARNGRKVVFVGRSVESKAEIARRLEYLHYNEKLVVPLRKAKKLASDEVLYIISGCYGQVGSALYRVSLNKHDFLKLEADDVVIFSADPAPPGTEQTTNFIIDNLIELGAEVHYYDTQEDLHVSGHGSQKEIEMLFALTKPRYLLPIGSTSRHMRAYKILAIKMGWKPDEVFELRPGAVVEFASSKHARQVESIPVRSVLVDGLGIGDVGEVVLSDRKVLAKEGVVIVIVQRDKQTGDILSDPEIISRGFVFVKKHREFLAQAGKAVAEELRRKAKNAKIREVKRVISEFLDRYFYEETGRKPMIMPVVIEV